MSKSDHSMRRIDRRNDDGWRVTRRHNAAMSKREAIAEQLVEIVLPGQHLRPGVIRMSGARPLAYDGIADTSSYTIESREYSHITDRERKNMVVVPSMLSNSTYWREVLLSDCEHGCKVYERVLNGMRERQVQHSSVYGCRDTDGPITRSMLTQVRKTFPRKQVTPRAYVVTGSMRSLMRPGVIDAKVYEVPSLMQLARRGK